MVALSSSGQELVADGHWEQLNAITYLIKRTVQSKQDCPEDCSR